MACTQTLKELGYRLTPQRRLILSIIHKSENHTSAEELYSKVHSIYPRVNISTVYRTLELLKERGLVTETDLGGGRLRYHLAEKGNHHHLICRNCGRVLELDETPLMPIKERLLQEYGFAADLSHLAVFGQCRECLKESGQLSAISSQ